MTDLTGAVRARMPRVSFTALNTGETYYFPYVPETFAEEVNVRWSKQDILGMSHQNDQYSYTENHMFQSLNFFFVGKTVKEVDLIHEGRRFLLSLCYPAGGAGTVRQGGPSRILFVWPQVVTMTCKLETLKIIHEKFNVSGRTVQFRADIKVSEIRDQRLTSQDVREQGTQRSGDISNQQADLPTFQQNSLELRDLPDNLA